MVQNRPNWKVKFGWKIFHYQNFEIWLKIICKYNKKDGKENKLSKEKLKEKDVYFFVLSQAWDKEKILSPHEESNFRPSAFTL